MTTNKPVAKFKAGAVSAAVWSHEIVSNGRTMPMLKVSVERRYKDASGEWKSSTSFSRNEIPLAMFVLAKAFEHMLAKPEQDEAPEEAVQ
ncbi:MAG: hypothetical protein HUU22_15105 [Phycisphaerae bacterium]|nr:hypothetical protein [Phycisphaerae bacterium]NUQ47351.1 hypothetical protein [Phycisphaerae bacterium]